MQPHDFLLWLWSFFSEIRGSFLLFNNLYYILFCIWVSYLKCHMGLSKQHRWHQSEFKPQPQTVAAVWLGKVLSNSRKGNNSYFSRVCVKTSGSNTSKKYLVQYLKPKRGLINLLPLFSSLLDRQLHNQWVHSVHFSLCKFLIPTLF